MGSTNGWQPRQVASSELLAGLASLRLQPHIRVRGAIVDAKDRSISNAMITLRLSSAGRRDGDLHRDQLRADQEGRFSVPVPERGDGIVSVIAPGYAPELRMVEVVPGTAPIQFILGQGQPLRVRVQDNTGAPVPDAAVSLNTWNGLRSVNWYGKADVSGRFIWTNAPVGGVQFTISKDGYHGFSPSFTVPSVGEQLVTLRKIARVSGTVMDADTGEPLDRVEIVPAWRSTATDPWRWQRGYSSKAKRGQFSMSLSELNRGDVKLLFESPGYMPVALGPFTQGGWITNQVALKKSRGVSGEVIFPAGSKNNRASVMLLGPDEETQLESGYQLRRINYAGVGKHGSRRAFRVRAAA